jgi:hypothetical protein
MAGQPLYIEDILAALRERRIGAETAVNWLEMRAAEQRPRYRRTAMLPCGILWSKPWLRAGRCRRR